MMRKRFRLLGVLVRPLFFAGAGAGRILRRIITEHNHKTTTTPLKDTVLL